MSGTGVVQVIALNGLLEIISPTHHRMNQVERKDKDVGPRGSMAGIRTQ